MIQLRGIKIIISFCFQSLEVNIIIGSTENEYFLFPINGGIWWRKVASSSRVSWTLIQLRGIKIIISFCFQSLEVNSIIGSTENEKFHIIQRYDQSGMILQNTNVN